MKDYDLDVLCVKLISFRDMKICINANLTDSTSPQRKIFRPTYEGLSLAEGAWTTLTIRLNKNGGAN